MHLASWAVCHLSPAIFAILLITFSSVFLDHHLLTSTLDMLVRLQQVSYFVHCWQEKVRKSRVWEHLLFTMVSNSCNPWEQIANFDLQLPWNLPSYNGCFSPAGSCIPDLFSFLVYFRKIKCAGYFGSLFIIYKDEPINYNLLWVQSCVYPCSDGHFLMLLLKHSNPFWLCFSSEDSSRTWTFCLVFFFFLKSSLCH